LNHRELRLLLRICVQYRVDGRAYVLTDDEAVDASNLARRGLVRTGTNGLVAPTISAVEWHCEHYTIEKKAGL
jgi:hypothetical protein